MNLPEGYVCAHTDFRFKALNKKRPKCPYCHKEMNHITKRVWGGAVIGRFHAEVELVCGNDKCPFIDKKEW